MKKINLLTLMLISVLVFSGCTLKNSANENKAIPTEISVDLTAQPNILSPSPTVEIIRPTSTATPDPAILEKFRPNQELTLSYIDMKVDEIGWGISENHHVLRTTDGGDTWRDVTPPEPTDAYAKEARTFFLDENTGWVTYAYLENFHIPGQPAVWVTFDGGVNWLENGNIPASEGSYAIYDPIQFFFTDQLHGWFLVHVESGMSHSYVYLFRTINGGIDWEEIINPYDDDMLQGCIKTDLAFTTPNDGLITVECGVMAGAHILNTNDGGESWAFTSLVSPLSSINLNADDVYCRSNNIIATQSPQFIVRCVSYTDGEVINPAFLRYKFEDNSFQFIGVAPTEDVQKVGDYLFAFGRDSFVFDESNNEWSLFKTVFWNGQYSFTSTSRGWAIATSSEEGAIALVSTEDGGTTWQEISPIIVP
jgi:photosystem II stability/assembly factor-like uncharacterized protein